MWSSGPKPGVLGWTVSLQLKFLKKQDETRHSVHVIAVILSESWIHALNLCVQGGTPEIHDDVLTPSCNHKVNRACMECMRQPSITCSSVWVALNPCFQLQCVHSTWYTLERESSVCPGDQLILTGSWPWPESHEEGFQDTLVKSMGEVWMGKNKWIWITHILDSLKAGLKYWEGTGLAWPFVSSRFRSSNWKWNWDVIQK